MTRKALYLKLKERGMMQQDLAREIGVHESAVSRWLTSGSGIPKHREKELEAFFSEGSAYRAKTSSRSSEEREMILFGLKSEKLSQKTKLQMVDELI